MRTERDSKRCPQLTGTGTTEAPEGELQLRVSYADALETGEEQGDSHAAVVVVARLGGVLARRLDDVDAAHVDLQARGLGRLVGGGGGAVREGR